MVVEGLPDGLVLFDGDDRLVLCNSRYRAIHALSAPALVEGARFADILRFGLDHGQYAVAPGQEGAWLTRRLAVHRDASGTIEERLGDGRWIEVTECSTPEGGCLGVCADITDRKLAEEAARAARDQLEAMLAAVPDLLFELDADGRFVDCHVRDANTLIAPPAAFLGRTLAEVLPPDVVATARAAIEEAARLGRSSGNQYRLEMPDGEHWYELLVARKAGSDAVAPHFIALARDITRRKELERKLAAERDFLERIMATSLAAIVAIDADGALVFANKEAERVLGVTASIATSRRFDHPAWRITAVDGGPYPMAEVPFVKVMATGQPVFDVRHAIEWPDGTRRVLSVNAAPLAESTGSLRRVVCSVTDITDRLQAENDLRYKEALLRGLFELCPVGIALNDLESGRFIDINDAIVQQTGYTREELLAMTFWELTPREHHDSSRRNLERMVDCGRYGPYEKENIRKDGSRFPVLLSGMTATDLTGRRLAWSIVQDITEQKAAEAQIIRQAHYDELTGLPNRRLFQERLEAALERARRGRHIGAVAMLDLDDFKTVNDSLGHRAGDAILVEAASRLAACTRATDTVARFGGDEFLILLDDIRAPGDAARITAKVQHALARPYAVEGRMLRLGVSIGIALYPADGDDIDELIRLADTAMYRAKRQGRNLTRFYAMADDA